MLPSQFWPGLRAFLMQYPQLLWLLQLRSGDAGAASGALMQTANLCKVGEESRSRSGVGVGGGGWGVGLKRSHPLWSWNGLCLTHTSVPTPP